MKRCPRCQNNYTDEVRWCPADGTPVEDVAPALSPAALAAAAASHIPDGAHTLRDMPAVGLADLPAELAPTIPEAAGVSAPTSEQAAALLAAPAGPNTLIGATSPIARPPGSPTGAVAIAVGPTLPGTPASPLATAPPGPHVPPPGAVTAGWDIPPSPTTVPGAKLPPINGPLHHTFMGTTSEPPRTPAGSPMTPAQLAAATGPQGNTFMGTASPTPRAPAVPHPPGPVSLGWEVPELPAGSTSATPSTPVSPAAHTAGPVSLGWTVPDVPADSSLTGTPSPVAALAAAQPAPVSPSTTLPGFAPSPEIVRALQEQRAKLAAQRQPEPMAAPEVSPEAFVASAPASKPPADPPAVQGTLPSLVPPPVQPAVVLMASQPPLASAMSQAPLPSVSMPHAVAAPPAIVEPAPVEVRTAPKSPTASMLEAPSYQADPATAAPAGRVPSAGDTDDHRTARGSKVPWIVLGVLVLAGGGVATFFLLQ